MKIEQCPDNGRKLIITDLPESTNLRSMEITIQYVDSKDGKTIDRAFTLDSLVIPAIINGFNYLSDTSKWTLQEDGEYQPIAGVTNKDIGVFQPDENNPHRWVWIWLKDPGDGMESPSDYETPQEAMRACEKYFGF